MRKKIYAFCFFSTVIAGAVTLMAFAPHANAGRLYQGPPGGGPPPAFSDLDRNQDGKITRDEWTGPADAFDRIDSNHDGVITQAEFNSFRPRRGGPPFGGDLIRLLDKDSDGKVSAAEFEQINQLFDKLDTDKSGALSQTELGRFFQVIGPGAPPDGRGPRPSFADMDTNKDLKISRDEWKGPAPLFDRMDANGDGVIDETEWNSAPQPGPRGVPPSISAGLLKLLDSDSDGSVTRAEFGRITGLFSSLDANQDGLLDPEEIGRFPRLFDEAGR